MYESWPQGKYKNQKKRLNYFFSSYNGWLTDLANRTRESCDDQQAAVSLIIINHRNHFNQSESRIESFRFTQSSG